MRSRLALGAVVLAGLLAHAATAAAAESLVTPYDRTLVRASGPPTTSNDTFAVPTTTGEWYVTVEWDWGTQKQNRTPHWIDPDNGGWLWRPADSQHPVPRFKYNPWKHPTDAFRDVWLPEPPPPPPPPASPPGCGGR